MPKFIKRDEIFKRRQRVSELRLKGLSIDAIHHILSTGDNQFVNAKTGKPYSRTTIVNDLIHLRDEWMSEARANIAEHKDRQFAELQEVKRNAWASGNLSAVLRAIDLEMKLLGTNSPVQIEMSIVTRLVNAIEATGRDPNPVLEAMIRHLESRTRNEDRDHLLE